MKFRHTENRFTVFQALDDISNVENKSGYSQFKWNEITPMRIFC